jgi:hypothetical protein
MAYRNQSPSRSGAVEDLAYGLGWFSIALGAAELIAPRALARTLGMQGSESILQAYGLREIASGIGILASDNPAPWLWGRVAGDALDIATLSTGLSGDNPQRDNLVMAIFAVAGVTALDLYCAQALSSGSGQPQRVFDYRDRSGFNRPVDAMRGAAASFEAPRDFQTPDALRPYASG